MIKSFKSKPLKKLFETGKSAKVQPKHLKKLTMILSLLNSATNPNQMAGIYAVDVDGNTRLTFKFDGTNAVEADYGDYH